MKHVLIAAIGALLMAVPALANPFVPKPEVLSGWQRSDGGAEVDYSAWAAFLKRYRSVGSDGIARIAYGSVTSADRVALAAFVRGLGRAPVESMTRPQQIAYWINLYNAETVKLVLDAYPVKSIRKINGGLLDLGPWDKPAVKIGSAILSLNDIEHRILRPIFHDARIHFAVNCASIGCPNIAAVPFDGAHIDAELDAAARAFINHPRGIRLENGKLAASSIFDWYAADFGGKTGVIPFARKFASDRTQSLLKGRTRIDTFSYDWDLNDRR